MRHISCNKWTKHKVKGNFIKTIKTVHICMAAYVLDELLVWSTMYKWHHYKQCDCNGYKPLTQASIVQADMDNIGRMVNKLGYDKI